MFEQVQGPEQLIIVEILFLVHDEFNLAGAYRVFEDAVRVEIRFKEASSEKALPFLAHIEWVKGVAQILFTQPFENYFELTTFERLVYVNIILGHAKVNFGSVSGGLWRVVLQVRDLIVMAKYSQLLLEAEILNVDPLELLQQLLVLFVHGWACLSLLLPTCFKKVGMLLSCLFAWPSPEPLACQSCTRAPVSHTALWQLALHEVALITIGTTTARPIVSAKRAELHHCALIVHHRGSRRLLTLLDLGCLYRGRKMAWIQCGESCCGPMALFRQN